MPRTDGTGPEGQGAKTGRGLGDCKIGQGPRQKRRQSRSQTQNPENGQPMCNRGLGRGLGKRPWKDQSVKTD
ncbi:MAG: DUF5320 domain-containing protein [Desulfobacteraceae bacterium]|nr:DUF5320 domain-containing protein [Desulfobacteraceae bacterium]